MVDQTPRLATIATPKSAVAGHVGPWLRRVTLGEAPIDVVLERAIALSI